MSKIIKFEYIFKKKGKFNLQLFKVTNREISNVEKKIKPQKYRVIWKQKLEIILNGNKKNKK